MAAGPSQNQQHAATASQPYPWHEDFYFGPSSEHVDIPGFLSAAKEASEKPLVEKLPEGADEEKLVDDCSVADLKNELDLLLSIKGAAAAIRERHDKAAQEKMDLSQQIAEQAAAKSSKAKARAAANSRKRKREELEETETVGRLAKARNEAPQIAYIREELDGLKLRIGGKPPNQARFFVRRPRMSDQNSLQSVLDNTLRPVELREVDELASETDDPDVVLSINVYTAHSVWPNGLHLSSSHDLLASNSLADLLRTIPCQSTLLPHAGERKQPVPDLLDRACIGIEHAIYGRHPRDAKGVGALLKYVNEKRPWGIKLTASDVALEHVRLGSLPLRMGFPYWVFHAGMCEHIWVITGIHLHHHTDPDQAAYPLTTFLPGSTALNCGICKLLPAVLAISNDIRLGESPCLVCKSCWDLLGWPRGDEEIKVVRLIAPRTATT